MVKIDKLAELIKSNKEYKAVYEVFVRLAYSAEIENDLYRSGKAKTEFYANTINEVKSSMKEFKKFGKAHGIHNEKELGQFISMLYEIHNSYLINSNPVEFEINRGENGPMKVVCF